jgi:hypothetical protein
MQRCFFFLITAALAAFALPVLGASQPNAGAYDMTITATGPVTLRVVLKNVTPQSTGKGSNTGNNNATITSFSITFTNAAPVSGADVTTGGNVTTTPKKNTVFNPSGNTLYVSGFYPLKPDGSQLVFDITLANCGDNLTIANAVASTSTGALPGGSGLPFTPDATASAAIGATYSVACGAAACGGNVPVPNGPLTVGQPGSIVGMRGDPDKDGSDAGCTDLAYFVTTVGATTHFRWSLASGPAATFEYTVYASGALPLAPPGPLDPAPPYPNSYTQVSWLPASGTPVFIVAQECLDPKVLPTPYGSLNANVLAGATTIAVDITGSDLTVGVDVTTPFDIVLGPAPNTERLTVTSAPVGAPGVYTWTLASGTANGHSAGAKVMSTPLPFVQANLVTNVVPAGTYTAGAQAQICIADRQSAGSNHSTTFIDINDGWNSQP